jgi:uncharacterized protein (DUF697 family)
LGIVKTYAYWSIVPGLLPVPVLDIALLIGIQLKMVSQMSELYEVPFSKNATKSIISSLLGSIIPKVGFGCTGFFIKSIPLVGGALGILFMPAFAWAATYAIGKVFILHFESGGTLLDFDPAEVRDYFRQEFEQEYAKRKHEVNAAG